MARRRLCLRDRTLRRQAIALGLQQRAANPGDIEVRCRAVDRRAGLLAARNRPDHSHRHRRCPTRRLVQAPRLWRHRRRPRRATQRDRRWPRIGSSSTNACAVMLLNVLITGRRSRCDTHRFQSYRTQSPGVASNRSGGKAVTFFRDRRDDDVLTACGFADRHRDRARFRSRGGERLGSRKLATLTWCRESRHQPSRRYSSRTNDADVHVAPCRSATTSFCVAGVKILRNATSRRSSRGIHDEFSTRDYDNYRGKAISLQPSSR
jgi:hypothetical protein